MEELDISKSYFSEVDTKSFSDWLAQTSSLKELSVANARLTVTQLALFLQMIKYDPDLYEFPQYDSFPPP